jgi:hypothetical protein
MLSIEERNLPDNCLSFYQEVGNSGGMINYEEYSNHFDAWKREKELKSWNIYRFIDVSHWEGRRFWSGRIGNFILQYF